MLQNGRKKSLKTANMALLTLIMILVWVMPSRTSIQAQGSFIGEGCTTPYYIDNDCDGYGVGARSDGDYSSRDDSGGLLGDMPDADDHDPEVNTASSVSGKYGDLRAFLMVAKGYNVGKIYYIATDGNDLTGQPNNPSAPYQHWYRTEGSTQFGVRHLLQPGDVVIYRGGKYDDPGIGNSIGTEEKPIVVMSYPGETVVFDSTDVAVSIRGSSNTIVIGFIITNSRNFPWGHGITLGDSSNCSFINNEVTNFNWPSGMQGMHDLTIEGNVFHDMLEHGLYLGARDLPSTNINIKGNIFYRNGRGGGYGALQYNGRVTNLVVDSNIMHSNYNWGISFKEGVSHSVVKNNLIFNNLGWGVIFDLYPGDCYSGGNICPYGQTHNLIVNNTFWLGKYDFSGDIPMSNMPNGSSAIGFAYDSGVEAGLSQDYNVFQNNIFVTCGGPIFDFHERNEGFASTTTIENNVIYKLGNSDVIMKVGSESYNFASFEEFSTAIRNNQFANPSFQDASIYYYATPEHFNFNLTVDSPAIDFGIASNAPDYDLRGQMRPQGLGYDSGCYENVSGGSTIPGDINLDNLVNALDLQLCLNIVLEAEQDPLIVDRADINHDGKIDQDDVQAITQIILGFDD